MTHPLLPTGDPELDAFRSAIYAGHPTPPDLFWERVVLAWAFLMLLQRLDADLETILPWIDRIESCPVEEHLEQVCHALDVAMQEMEVSFCGHGHVPGPVENGPSSFKPKVSSDWRMYGGNASHTAATSDPGPSEGHIHWTHPMGFAWYASPLVEEGRVYLSCPGMREQMRCLHLKSGEEIWSTVRRREGRPRPTSHIRPQSYIFPAAASTPVRAGSDLLVAELGAQGLEKGARGLLRIDRKNGQLQDRQVIGFADYRMGTARLAGNEEVVVHPDGEHRIEASPPQSMGHNRLVCRSARSGVQLWEFPVGLFFADPVVAGDRVILGTADGLVFCLSLTLEAQIEGFGRSDTERVLWMIDARAPVNGAAAVSEGTVCIGANNGKVFAVDFETGTSLWDQQLEDPELAAFQYFSPPAIQNGKVWIGSAAASCSCLDLNTGEILWK